MTYTRYAKSMSISHLHQVQEQHWHAVAVDTLHSCSPYLLKQPQSGSVTWIPTINPKSIPAAATSADTNSSILSQLHQPKLSNSRRGVTWSYHSRLLQVHSGHHPPCPLELLPFTFGPPLDWPFGFGPPGPPPDKILPLLLPKVPPPPPMLPPPPEAGGGKVWPPPYAGGYP